MPAPPRVSVLTAPETLRVEIRDVPEPGLDDAAGALLAPRRDATALKAVVHPDPQETAS